MEVLHIGFPKTATTTLQVHVFANHPEILNVARPFGDQRHERLWTSIAVDDDMDYPEQELARLVEVAVPRDLFWEILRLIDGLRRSPPVPA